MQLSRVQDVSLLPREKIVHSGASSLSSEELLAAILGSGHRQGSVRQLASQIVEKLPQQSLSLAELRQIPGVGLARACQILAVLEFVERLRPQNSYIVNSLNRVLDAVTELRSAQREMVYGLYLDSRLQLLRRELLAVGSVNEAVVQPRDIFSVIKQQPICYLILTHNHPSGVCKPSPEDISLTKHIQEAGELLGVTLLDHVIVTAGGHYSFKAAGQLAEFAQESSLPAASRRRPVM